MMNDGSCFFCLSIKTGGSVIGILTCTAFLHNLVSLILLQRLVLYYSIATLFYGVPTFAFIRHRLAKDSRYYLSSRMYFKSFLIFIYIGGNIWHFVFWYCLPEQLEEACNFEQQCISSYQAYAFWVWVFTSIASSYFAFVLREYKNRMEATLDKIEEQLIDEKIKEIQELSQNSRKGRLTEKLLTSEQ